MRPRRTSVACSWGAGVVARETRGLRIMVVFVITRIMREWGEKHKRARPAPQAQGAADFLLGGNHSHTEIGRMSRVREQADRNEIHAGLSVGTNIVETNPA